MKYSIEELRKLNIEKIEKLKNDNRKNEINKELEIQLTIKEILNEDSCFFKVDMKTAINILNKLIERESIEETYLDLISARNFKKINN